MSDILSSFSTKSTPQTSRARVDQKQNAAGGYVFQTSDEQRLRRFLLLGTEGGTYYASASDLTRENAEFVIKLLREDHALVRRVILDVSLRGAAPKQNPTIFVLALACSFGTEEERKAALAMMPQVARTGTHLFLFAKYAQQFRGWGRGLRRSVGSWYTEKDVDALAYQVVKYRNREGWTHRDLLRKSHPKTDSPEMHDVFEWIVRGTSDGNLPSVIEGFLKAQEPGADIPALVRKHRLSWEMLPDAALNDVPTWDALLRSGVPQTALMRNLPRLTRLGLIGLKANPWTRGVEKQLRDATLLANGRIHPMSVLVASSAYGSGRGRSGAYWNPSPIILDALEDAFYAAFGAVQPSNKRTLVALDVSASMDWAHLASAPSLSPRVASAAMALVTLASEPEADVVGFSRSLQPLNISAKMRLPDVVRAVSNLPHGGTDAALPAQWAVQNNLPYESIVIYTDNETWGGSQHPYQVLETMRQRFGIPVRQVVVGMTATDFSIADPNDPLSLDVAGFDPSVPSVISAFARG